MDFGLTQEQKKIAYTNAKNNLSLEITNMFIRLGLDPDAYTDGDAIEVSAQLIGEKDRLDILLASYKTAVLKLAELG